MSHLLAAACHTTDGPAGSLAGTHLIAHGLFRTLDRGGQFVLLGSAPDPKIQGEFDELANQARTFRTRSSDAGLS